MTRLGAVVVCFGVHEGRAMPALPDLARVTGKKNSNDCARLSLLASVASAFHKSRKIEEIRDKESFPKSVATLATARAPS